MLDLLTNGIQIIDSRSVSMCYVSVCVLCLSVCLVSQCVLCLSVSCASVSAVSECMLCLSVCCVSASNSSAAGFHEIQRTSLYNIS